MYFEVIGSEGSGKTTLCKEIRELSGGSIKAWEDIKVAAIKSFINAKKIELNGFDVALLALCSLNNKILHYLIQTKLKFDPKTFDDDWNEFLISLLRVNGFKTDTKLDCWLSRMNWLVEAIFRARVSRFYSSNGAVLLLDEGATHYAASDKRLWGKCPMPDGVLFLKTDPDVAFEGILKRSERQLNRGHRSMNNDTLYKSVVEQHKRFSEFVKYLSGEKVYIIECKRNEGCFEKVLIKIQQFVANTNSDSSAVRV